MTLPTRFLATRFLATAAAVLVLAGATPREAEAQPFGGSISTACVGGPIGCSQVDFFATLLAGTPASVTSFEFILLSPGWTFRFPAFVEAEDDLGLLLAAGTLSGDRKRFAGQFFVDDAVAPAILDPTLRLRAEFDTFEGNTENLACRIIGRDASQAVVFDLSCMPSETVIPEPATMLLVGSGLSGLLGIARRRTRESAG